MHTPACMMLLLTVAAVPALGQQGDRAGESQPSLPATLEIPPAPPRSPEESLRSFSTHDGLRVELVAAEPLVVAPVALDLATDGRIWVVEMTGYMTDLEGSEELEPNGRIVVLADEDGVVRDAGQVLYVHVPALEVRDLDGRQDASLVGLVVVADAP